MIRLTIAPHPVQRFVRQAPSHQSLFHRTNMRRDELPSPSLFYPHMRRLKLTAVCFVVRLATPRREHRHDRRVPIQVYFYFVVDSLGFGLRGLSSRLLAGESLGLV